ncbi:histidine phosphatase family protein [Corynebacterium heidelbergense]|uniref:Histidine phosphatase family protein n=1 Tax=Corynebacterium heidelbergense TaxID=2055947 RepID=A0A364VB01_9CORY|nr:histidine phosphatase family protein [Corynebacterium heidelbergense]RAV33746.1 histidine phosphatase family protein [Corynebacterium heidelbergense]WCZ35699.1 Histidine phosphatase superfamily (branch 1) [Corynebacterium heidelbergense]
MTQGDTAAADGRLFLVRHGQTTSNTIHALDTALPGADLTELGREQAVACGRGLAELLGQGAGVEERPRLLVVSSLAARAQQTAALLACGFEQSGGELVSSAPGSAFAQVYGASREDVAGTSGLGGEPRCAVPPMEAPTDRIARRDGAAYPLGALPGLSEIAAGDMEMRNDEDSHAIYHGFLGQWMHGDLDTAVPGGFSGREILERYVPTLVRLWAATQAMGAQDALGEDHGAAASRGAQNSSVLSAPHVAIVSHGAVIRLVAQWLGAVDPEFAFASYLANTQFVELVPRGGALAGVGQGPVGEFRAQRWHGAFDIVSWGQAKFFEGLGQ